MSYSCSKTLQDFLLPKSWTWHWIPWPEWAPLLTKLVSWPHLEQILHIPVSECSLLPLPCSPGLLSTNLQHRPCSPTHWESKPSFNPQLESHFVQKPSTIPILHKFSSKFLQNMFSLGIYLHRPKKNVCFVQARTTLHMYKITSFNKPSIMVYMQVTLNMYV